MDDKQFIIEPATPFSKSLLWELNRDYYQQTGIAAWSEDVVPHHMTSNSMVGKTYAELVLGFLKDLNAKGQSNEKVYILELGAGHGRFAFHLLKHLLRLIELESSKLPPFCYVISDIVEENLAFFLQHPQFKTYLDSGIVDVAYYDAISSDEVILRHSGEVIRKDELKQPLLVIANYFFDSIPSDLFYVKNQKISSCYVALSSEVDPQEKADFSMLENLDVQFQSRTFDPPFYTNSDFEFLLNKYKSQLSESYLFFPAASLKCLNQLQRLSKQGLFLLSMDKGFHEMYDLNNKKEPEVITHGSFSLWVNFHAIGSYCEQQGGKAFYPKYSTFYLQMTAFLFLEKPDSYHATNAALQRYVNDFGPDDFNGIKRLVYQNISRLGLKDLIVVLRLSNYDSTFFRKILPRFKMVIRQISFNERKRIAETLDFIWAGYFYIDESFDLAYEIGGILYDLGFYSEAISYFEKSIQLVEPKPDSYYNLVLCHYQLRQDDLFIEMLDKAKESFPDYARFDELHKLDMNAT